MPKLYVANTSRQKAVILFRIPEETNPKRYEIRPGAQMVIYDGPSEIVDMIIKQHERYGMRKVSDVVKSAHFVGLSYSVDRELTVDNYKVAFKHNLDIQEQEGVQRRENVGTYSQGTVLNALRQNDPNFKGLTIEIKDVTKPNAPTFHEIFSDKAPAEYPDAKPRGRRARK